MGHCEAPVCADRVLGRWPLGCLMCHWEAPVSVDGGLGVTGTPSLEMAGKFLEWKRGIHMIYDLNLGPGCRVWPLRERRSRGK